VVKLVLFGTIVSVAILAGWWIAEQVSRTPSADIGSKGQPVRSPSKQVVHLYFGDARERHLVAEQRVVEQFDDDVALSRRLIELLIQGPSQGGSRTLPPDAKLLALHITGAGTAFLDFDAESFAAHPGGAAAELLSIYSIVNTLVLNVDSVRSVRFLIGGREAATLVGHADLQEVFEVDMLWVR